MQLLQEWSDLGLLCLHERYKAPLVDKGFRTAEDNCLPADFFCLI